MMILAPSLLAADFSRLGEEIKTVDEAGAPWLHLDVMDGVFVPSISFGMPVIEKIRPCTGMTFDVHMMVEEPGRYIDAMADAGAQIISVHLEACEDIIGTVMKIRERGLRPAVAINPETSAAALSDLLDNVDMFLLMSVHPGFGGQKFIPETLDKIRTLRMMLDRSGHPDTDIEVDGGIYLENVRDVIQAGANIIVSGTGVFKGSASDNVSGFLSIFAEEQIR